MKSQNSKYFWELLNALNAGTVLTIGSGPFGLKRISGNGKNVFINNNGIYNSEGNKIGINEACKTLS